METESIAALLTSITALIGVGIMMFKAWNEKPKVDAESEKFKADTIDMLSRQLHDAYIEIDAMHKKLGNIDRRLDYQDYLLRGIARLTASLAANEMTVPWTPMAYDEFVERQVEKEK